MKEYLYGKMPILEALRAGRRKLKHFYFSSDAEDPQLQQALSLCQNKRVPFSQTQRAMLDAKVPDVTHQGWLAEISSYPYLDYQELAKKSEAKGKSLILALDQIQDPQNLGAILRTAECCGVDGVLIPEDRSTSITAAVAKASAGAVEYLAISRVTNLVRSLKDFQEKGFWVVGTGLPGVLQEHAKQPVQNIFDFDWPAKTVLVMGSEGKGMRRLTEQSCDFLIYLPLFGNISSLNVSAAAAACLYEIVRKSRI